MKRFELIPTNRKSFYGKAYVIEADNGDQTLYSYDTPIIRRDTEGNLHRLYNGYTTTTGRHIAAFCELNKKQFMAMEVEG